MPYSHSFHTGITDLHKCLQMNLCLLHIYRLFERHAIHSLCIDFVSHLNQAIPSTASSIRMRIIGLVLPIVTFIIIVVFCL